MIIIIMIMIMITIIRMIMIIIIIIITMIIIMIKIIIYKKYAYGSSAQPTQMGPAPTVPSIRELIHIAYGSMTTYDEVHKSSHMPHRWCPP